MLVPWKRVASWHCNACGVCCRVYKPKLTLYEYLKLRTTGFVEEKAGKFYLKKVGGRCPFQRGNLCSLQQTIKPLSCKLFPFVILKKGSDDALFEFEDREYFVYADPFCPNLRIKRDCTPSVYSAVKEAIMLFEGRGEFKLLTSNQPKELQSLNNTFSIVRGRNKICNLS
ncbi:YkgJ family cysteine cluster protein [Archaeoglobus neptunius]|uniref:YkgJ family cysteine cluster protein n=1 Tax=Archaeoglobus neptunius TaxID=2798580 RepID=UPI0019256504|nr:YkgJ family cysteine cluster protein [Archaeoglobus neptunius]